MDESVSILMPAHNEVAVIEEVIREFYADVYVELEDAEFIVADDGSTDGTSAVLDGLADELDITVDHLDQRSGYHGIMRYLLDCASNELVFYSDSDDTHQAVDFWALAERIDDHDVVSGVRVDRETPRHRRLLSRGYNALVDALFGMDVEDTNSGFKLLRRPVVAEIVPQVHRLPYGFSTELLVRAHAAGYDIAQVPVAHSARTTGEAVEFRPLRLPRVVGGQLLGLARLRRDLLAAGRQR